MDTTTVVTCLLFSMFAFALLGAILVRVLSGQIALQIWYFILGLYSTILTIALYFLFAAIATWLAASDPDSQQNLLMVVAVLLRDSNQGNLAEFIEGLRRVPKEVQKFLVGSLLTVIGLNLIYPLVSFVLGLRNGSRNGRLVKTMQTDLEGMSVEINTANRKIDTLIDLFNRSHIP
jgi:hypothetical protein